MAVAMKFMDEELARMKEEGLYGNIRTLEGPQGAWVRIGGKEYLNLCSNNYLGLANDPRVRQRTKETIDRYGVGPGAVRTIAGTMDIHLELERKLAKFKGAEAALVVQSGFCGNLAVMPALTGEGDLIFSDSLNHASIIDACRLSRAGSVRYEHSDMEDLRAKLRENASSPGRKLIITDGVFSMDGDIAKLPEIVAVAQEFGAITAVDDAHGEGVLGRGGRGIVDHFHLHGRVDVEIGTMSKAFGAVGGIVAGSAVLIDYLRQKARPNLFSSALTVPDIAACAAAVEIMEESDDLVKKLWRNGDYLKAELKRFGFDTGGSETPITPVIIGEAQAAKDFSAKLFENGVFATAIVFPTVPKGTARVRAMVSAAHSRQDLDFGAAAFAKVGKEMNLISD
ncbi:MAG: glycine C-acetyltransferase [Synergistaceae bacterium]|jgi:glycine C-acetyltransferase|nr:glycine C-acetyltransferase [Synergistaceae bacterium]